MPEFLQHIDEAILIAVNSWNSEFCDAVMWWVSGKFTWLPFYMALLLFIFLKRKWKDGGMILLAIVLVIVLSDQSSVHLFKEVFQRPRPSHNPELTDQLHYVNGYKGGKYGFISSHASNVFAVAGFLILVLRKPWFSFVMLFWAVLVSYSRMYLGVHYFFDIFAGALWGLLLGYLVYHLYVFLRKKLLSE